MSKGEVTRETILDTASRLARTVGFNGMTIGALAARVDMSKSGLYAHFRSKESLQLHVLEHAKARFVREIIAPALTEPRGEPRMRALFENKIRWNCQPGGCLITAAATELDDQPGPVRDAVARDQRDWLDSLAQFFRSGVTEGEFRADVEPEQVAFELDGILLSHHASKRLLGDRTAELRARAAFEKLLTEVKVH